MIKNIWLTKKNLVFFSLNIGLKKKAKVMSKRNQDQYNASSSNLLFGLVRFSASRLPLLLWFAKALYYLSVALKDLLFPGLETPASIK